VVLRIIGIVRISGDLSRILIGGSNVRYTKAFLIGVTIGLFYVLPVAIIVRAQSTTVQPPTMTEADRLKIDVLNLQAQLTKALAEKADCYAVLGPLQAKANAGVISDRAQQLRSEFGEKFPDYDWTPDVGFTKKPKPVDPPTMNGKKPGGGSR
jgi:hypothetical protein